MTFYESVVEYETERNRALVDLARRSCPFLEQVLGGEEGQEMVEASIERLKIVLDAVNQNPRQPIKDKAVEEMLCKMQAMEEKRGGCVLREPEILQARKRLITATFEHYQGLASQEASSFEESARKQFVNKRGYWKALDPIVAAQEDLDCLVLEKVPECAPLILSLNDGARYLRKIAADYLFPGK